LAFPGRTGIARILHQSRGRIRLKVARLKTDEAYGNRLQSLLASMENVEHIRISPNAASVIIRYNPNIPATEFTAKLMKTIEGAAKLGLHQ